MWQNEYAEEKILFKDEEPQIEFSIEKLEGEDYAIALDIDAYGYQIIEGKNYIYFLSLMVHNREVLRDVRDS